MTRCSARYGQRRELVCRRLAGHRGKHRLQPTAAELTRILRR